MSSLSMDGFHGISNALQTVMSVAKTNTIFICYWCDVLYVHKMLFIVCMYLGWVVWAMYMRGFISLLALCAMTESVYGNSFVVQFVVHANEKSDVSRLFTGAYVDFTWNNVFVVSVWTNDPASLIKSIQETLASNSNILQVLVPPYTMETSTQKWLQYNLVWVALLVLVFTAGCICGGVLIFQCFDARKAIYRHRGATLF